MAIDFNGLFNILLQNAAWVILVTIFGAIRLFCTRLCRWFKNKICALCLWGRRAGKRAIIRIDGVEYAFRWCPPGEFKMGDKSSSHSVTLRHGFWMQETTVTQEQWEKITGQRIDTLRENYKKDDPPSGSTGKRYPMYYISWNDCWNYIEKLNDKQPVSGWQLDFPSEAEWEYACRAGTTGEYAGNLDEMAWYGNERNSGPREVGLKTPNPWGIYDMLGNVYEWCKDCCEKGTRNDPDPFGKACEQGSGRAIRGGCYSNDKFSCQPAYRFVTPPEDYRFHLGLRLVLRRKSG